MKLSAWLSQTRDDATGCYVHIPFCDRICPYCDFAVVGYKEQLVARYMTALEAEIERSTHHCTLQTLYVGGGTPSTLPRHELQSLLSCVFERYRTRPDTIECTLEANPARNIEDLAAWRAAGINRLSIGVQSLDDIDLHHLGRNHSAAQAVDFIAHARGAGFDNISIDLICGVPQQSRQSFAQTLERALALNVNHVSVYGLTIEAGTPYSSWYARQPGAFADDDLMADMLDDAHEVLSAAGFVHYEISNFALPGFESAHNTGYWRQRDCLGFGQSAAGYEQGLRYRNERNFERYCSAIERRESPRVEEERLGRDARLGEAAMLALRTARGIGYDDLLQRYGVRPQDAFASAINRCLAAGLLEVDDSGARLTRRGRLLANSVCAEFLVPQRETVVPV